MKHEPRLRILAISPRQSRFGYALFEGPDQLLDWGASSIPAHSNGPGALEAARKRIGAVLQRCHPAAVVAMRPRRTKTGKTATEGPIYKAFVQQSVILGVPICILGRADVAETFRSHNAHNSEQIAEVLASIFPELLTRLPPKRKKWQPARRVMVVFDAAAVGVAYWRREESEATALNKPDAPRAFPPAPH